MFIRNDPMFVESTHLPTYVTKTKPDVILAELECCKKWLGVESATFKRCAEIAGESQGKRKKRKGKARNQEEKCGWTPIVQFWEFRMLKRLKGLSKILRSPFGIDSLTPSTGERHSAICHEYSLRGEIKPPRLWLLSVKAPLWLLKDSIRAT